MGKTVPDACFSSICPSWKPLEPVLCTAGKRYPGSGPVGLHVPFVQSLQLAPNAWVWYSKPSRVRPKALSILSFHWLPALWPQNTQCSRPSELLTVAGYPGTMRVHLQISLSTQPPRLYRWQTTVWSVTACGTCACAGAWGALGIWQLVTLNSTELPRGKVSPFSTLAGQGEDRVKGSTHSHLFNASYLPF